MHDRITFPLVLDLAALRGLGMDAEGDDEDLQYDLYAILVHKGPSAFHGHYGTTWVCWVYWVYCWNAMIMLIIHTIHLSTHTTTTHHTLTVAHVRDFATDTWWRVDDEETSLLQYGPASGTADHGSQGDAGGADNKSPGGGRVREGRGVYVLGCVYVCGM